MIDTANIQNELNRTAKMFLDTGEAATVDEAYAILGSYHLSVRLGADVAHSPTLQAALLTIVNTGRRCFHGGVEVAGCPDADLLVYLEGACTLEQAIIKLEGRLVESVASTHPEVVIGDTNASTTSDFSIRATYDGWIGGVAPVDDGIRLAEAQEFTPAGVLAGSLAVSEAFQFVRRKNPMAGSRPVGFSLWEPHSNEDWTATRNKGPELELLPARLWLIGLGHLGQAYLWTLGFLPFANPEEVLIVLQDTDRLSVANDSTSPLTNTDLVDQPKTRAMAAWCEARGFQTRIVERLFADDFRIAGDEPMVALCGVDNGLARASLEDVGFSRVIEAGLGRGTDEFLAFQIHSFPGAKTAREIWDSSVVEPLQDQSIEAAAYADLGERGVDKCGLTLLANRAVGASFVGTFASTLVIAEVLRMLAGAAAFDVMDGTLRQPNTIEAIVKTKKLQPFNPGITPASPAFSDAANGVEETTKILVEA